MAENQWFKSYDAGVPYTLEPYPQSTLVDILSTTAKQRPEHIFTIFKEQRLTYGEVDRLTAAMAAGLAARGVKTGTTVAIILPISPQAIISQFAVWKAGGIPVPLNPLYTQEELKRSISESGVEAAIVFSALYPVIKSIQTRNSRLKSVIAVDVDEYPDLVAKIQAVQTVKETAGKRPRLRGNDSWMCDIVELHRNDAYLNLRVRPEDIALILQSGGTTGTPRGIMLTHKALIAEAMQIRAWTNSVLLEWDDIILLTLPLFHVFGNAAVLATAIVGHNPLAIVPDPRDHDELLNTITRTKPAFFPAVPTLFKAVLEHRDVKSKKVDLSSIKIYISGATALSTELRESFFTATGKWIIQGYGLTETAAAITADPIKGQIKEGSCGLPLPDVIIKIVDSEKGERDMPRGKAGEIAVKCPQVMQGFWNSLEETGEMLRDGWLYTGDIGYMDDDGYIFITARKKQLIKISGFQVWPEEIATVIRSHPAVAAVCVSGIPDSVQGESVKAWVVLRTGKKCTLEELQAYCRRKLTAYKVPRYIEFRESLPTTEYGVESCGRLADEEKKKQASSLKTSA